MDLKRLNSPLTADQIDFRIQSINKGGYATILAYKNARVDMERLDMAVGPLNWRREHCRENHNCIVSIWDESKNQWVPKEDTGIESYSDAEKGLASDSFKRACFNWGIGRELYDYPFIQVKLNNDEFKIDNNGKVKQTWELRLNSWRWKICFVGETSTLRYIKARDENGSERFLWFSLNGLADSINAIKEALLVGDLCAAAQCWSELEDGEKGALWVAESKGGPFDANERKIMQSKEFREASL